MPQRTFLQSRLVNAPLPDDVRTVPPDRIVCVSHGSLSRVDNLSAHIVARPDPWPSNKVQDLAPGRSPSQTKARPLLLTLWPLGLL
eukprot:SAG31_NODE_2667_length_5273_cov_2.316776_6_plen_86_part_00